MISIIILFVFFIINPFPIFINMSITSIIIYACNSNIKWISPLIPKGYDSFIFFVYVSPLYFKSYRRQSLCKGFCFRKTEWDNQDSVFVNISPFVEFFYTRHSFLKIQYFQIFSSYKFTV